jgi:hypothetical protein
MFTPAPDGTTVDSSYRSVFGPSIAHNGVIYDNSPENICLAMRRLTAARGSILEDRRLALRQRRFLEMNAGFLLFMQCLYTAHFPDYDGAGDSGYRHYADTHPKKRLRVDAWEALEIGDYHGFNLTDTLYVSNVTYKMKKDEIAKPGKYPRMIGDLGVAASLQAFTLVNHMKHVMSDHPIDYMDATFTFCLTPEPTRLAKLFEQLIDPPKRVMFIYFSDDATFAVRHDGIVYMYNLDISSCDASHQTALFEALVRITPSRWQHEMQGLIDQCKLPITITNPHDDNEKVTLQPLSHRLYSGSTITTLINNFANILIAKAITDSGAYLPEHITSAAASVGYLVSVQRCTQPQDIQFLKHSPVYDSNGHLRAMLNLGVMLRSMGQCKGDLPGRGDISLRASKFNHAYIAGMYPRCLFDLRDSLLQRFHSTEERFRTAQEFDFKVVNSGDYFYVPSIELYKRYRLEPDEIEEVDSLGEMRLFEQYASPTIAKILELDYGLGVTTL